MPLFAGKCVCFDKNLILCNFYSRTQTWKTHVFSLSCGAGGPQLLPDVKPRSTRLSETYLIINNYSFINPDLSLVTRLSKFWWGFLWKKTPLFSIWAVSILFQKLVTFCLQKFRFVNTLTPCVSQVRVPGFLESCQFSCCDLFDHLEEDNSCFSWFYGKVVLKYLIRCWLALSSFSITFLSLILIR